MEFNRNCHTPGHLPVGGATSNSVCDTILHTDCSKPVETCKPNICGVETRPEPARPICDAYIRPRCSCRMNRCANPCQKPPVCPPQDNCTDICDDFRPVQCRNTLGHAPHLSLAMAYIPDQKWEDLYDCNVGFEHGTIFKQLDKPWLAGWRC